MKFLNNFLCVKTKVLNCSHEKKLFLFWYCIPFFLKRQENCPHSVGVSQGTTLLIVVQFEMNTEGKGLQQILKAKATQNLNAASIGYDVALHPVLLLRIGDMIFTLCNINPKHMNYMKLKKKSIFEDLNWVDRLKECKQLGYWLQLTSDKNVNFDIIRIRTGCMSLGYWPQVIRILILR